MGASLVSARATAAWYSDSDLGTGKKEISANTGKIK